MGLSAYRLARSEAGTCQQMEIEAIKFKTPRILIGQVRDERFACRADAKESPGYKSRHYL